TLSKNEADARGGGIANGGGQAVVTLVQSTLSGNRCPGFGDHVGEGGGIDHRGALLEVLQCTIFGNEAGGGGGIRSASVPVDLSNSIIAHNKATKGKKDFGGPTGKVVQLGVNWVEDGTFGNDGDTIFSGDPQLNTRLAGNGGPTLTHAPRPGSPV